MGYYSGIILADSPIRYYPLNETSGTVIHDLANGQNGTATVVGITYGVTGLIAAETATTLAFNGSTGNISVPVSGIPSGNNPWSQECWLNTSNVAFGSQMLMSMGTWGTNNQAASTEIKSSGLWGVEFGDGTDAGQYNLSNNTTYHSVVTWDGSNMRLYVNGILQKTSGAFTLSLGNTACYIANAAEATLHDQYFGTLQHVAIYNYALTPAQISLHYEAGSQGPTQYFVQIAGKQANLLAGTLSVQNQIGQRSTGSAQVWSPLNTFWQYGTGIQMYDTTNSRVYSGFITKDKVTKSGSRLGQGYLEHQLTCVDNCYKADKRVIFYSNTNVTAGQIVQDLVNKVLYQEGVTYTSTSIAGGLTVPEVIWNGKTISACLDWLAKNSGYYWNIDVNSVLWFQPYGAVPGPFILDGTQMDAGSIGGLSVEYGNDLYVNTQFTLGGNAEKGSKKNPLHETLWGDGKRTSGMNP